MTKRILITGATGFIGNFLVQEAIKRGYQVWAGVRKSSNTSRLLELGVNFIDLDYKDEEHLHMQIETFIQSEGGIWDYIIHNAGITKTPNINEFYEVNSYNTQRFIKALEMCSQKPKKFTLMSSMGSYGVGDEIKFTPKRIDDEQNPNNHYGKSKKLAEDALKEQSSFPYLILMPTGVYGPGDKDYFLAIKAIKKGVDFKAGMIPQRITFIYVSDLARYAFALLENEQVINRAFFISDGDVYTDKEYTEIICDELNKKFVLHLRIPLLLVYIACCCGEAIAKISGKPLTLNKDKYKILAQRNWIGETDSLREAANILPEYNLRKGVRASIDWYTKEGWL